MPKLHVQGELSIALHFTIRPYFPILTSPRWKRWWSRRRRWCPGTAGMWFPGSRRGRTPTCRSDCPRCWAALPPPAPSDQLWPGWPDNSWSAFSCGAWWGPRAPPWCSPRCRRSTPAEPGTPTQSCTPGIQRLCHWESVRCWLGCRFWSSHCPPCLPTTDLFLPPMSANQPKAALI